MKSIRLEDEINKYTAFEDPYLDHSTGGLGLNELYYLRSLHIDARIYYLKKRGYRVVEWFGIESKCGCFDFTKFFVMHPARLRDLDVIISNPSVKQEDVYQLIIKQPIEVPEKHHQHFANLNLLTCRICNKMIL